jgi:hypothetical protein
MSETRSITIEIPTAVAQKLVEWHEGTLEHATTLALRLYSGMGKEGYSALQSLAHASDTTPTKALREAIFHAQRTINAPAAPLAVGRPKINTERDAAIYAAVTQQGKTYSQAALVFNLSLVRVGQIIAQQRAERGETGRKFAPKAAPAPKPEPKIDTPEEAQAKAKRKAADAISNAMLDMLNGTPAATAAKKYELDVERTRAAYAAYSAIVSASSTKADKATAIFPAFTAYDEYGTEPKVLTLKDSAETQAEDGAPAQPAKPRYVMPALEALKAQQADALPIDTRTAKERDVFNPEFGF